MHCSRPSSCPNSHLAQPKQFLLQSMCTVYLKSHPSSYNLASSCAPHVQRTQTPQTPNSDKYLRYDLPYQRCTSRARSRRSKCQDVLSRTAAWFILRNQQPQRFSVSNYLAGTHTPISIAKKVVSFAVHFPVNKHFISYTQRPVRHLERQCHQKNHAGSCRIP